MKDLGQTLRRAILLALAGALVVIGSAAAQLESDSASKQPNQAQVEKLDNLIAALGVERNEARALDADAKTASPSDASALRAAALEIRLAGIDVIEQAVVTLKELEAAGGEATAYRRQIAGFMPELSAGIKTIDLGLRESIAALQSQLAEAGADARPALEQRLRRQEALRGRVIEAAVEQVARLELLGLAADADRSWAQEQVASRARLMSGRVSLITQQLSDLEAVQGADPASLAAQSAALQSQMSGAADALADSAALLEALGMDASRYKEMLISSTGEITSDILDTNVAGQLIARWASGLKESVAENGPRVAFQTILFLIVIGFFWALSRFVGKLTSRAVEAPHLRFSKLLKRMLVSLASGLVMLIGVLVALSQLGFQVGPMVAGLGIAGFIVGFALQETLGNFAAGVMILAYRPYDVGDLIECAGSAVFGRVSHMSLVSTTILTLDNQTRMVPNGKIWGDVITNVTDQKLRRVDLVFGISYSDDIPHAEEVLWSIVKEHPKIVEDPAPVVKVHELGDSSVNFVVRPWTAADDYWDVHWDVTREVKLRFDREGVSIPFPQRDVHFHASNGNAAEPIHLESTPQVGSTARSGQEPPEATD